MKSFIFLLFLSLPVFGFEIVDTGSQQPYVDQELSCLAKTVYFETRGEPLNGQYAVAQVVLNRVNSEMYPNAICEVVYQQYQFSWTASYTNPSAEALTDSVAVAKDVLNGKLISEFSEVLSFHNTSVNPGWASRMTFVGQIGHHLFYAP